MFLKSLYLKNFKKFKELDLRFSSDITVVKGPNEQGKSTIVSALVAGLFYDPKKDNEAMRELKSWSSNDLYEIKMTFEENGTDWELVKDFQNKKSLLINKENQTALETHKEISEVLYNLGGYRSAGLFYSTTCVKQDTLNDIGSGKREIEEALQDLVTSGADNVNVLSIIKKLDKEINEIERGMERPVKNPGTMKKLKDIIEIKREEYGKILQQVKEFKENNEKVTKIKFERDRTINDLQIRRRELEDIRKYFDSQAVINQATKEVKQLEQDLRSLETLEKENNKIINQTTALPDKNYTSSEHQKVILIILFSFAIIGLLGFFIHPVLFLGFLAAAGVGGWYFVTKNQNGKPSPVKAGEVDRKIAQYQGMKEGILRGRKIEDLQEEYQQVIRRISIEEDKINPIYRKSPPKSRSQLILEQEMENLLKKKETLDREEARLESVVTTQRDFQNDLFALEELAEDLNNQLLYVKNKLDVYKMMRGILLEVKDATVASIKGKLKECMNRFIFEITHNRYNQVDIDNDLRLSVFSNEKGDYVEVDKNLSRGTIDQFYLVSRFALLEILSAHKKPIIILDDPFVNFDTERRIHTKHICQNLASKFQIILFTHSDEYDDWGEIKLIP